MSKLCTIAAVAARFAVGAAVSPLCYGEPIIRSVALSGEQAPGAAPGVVFGVFGDPVLNSAGHTAFSSTLTGPGVDASNNSGIYIEGSGTLAEVVREGNQAPEAAPGVVFGGVDPFSPPVLSATGQVAFFSKLTGPGVNSSNDRGIYRAGSGTVAQVTREGVQAPGATSGVVFADFTDIVPTFNRVGQTALFGILSGPGVDFTNLRRIYSEGSGTLAEVARQGNQAPGAASGVVFDTFSPPRINTIGQTAFFGFLTGPGVDGSNNEGIYKTESGTLAEVARTGDQAPGAASGVVLSDIIGFGFNAAGQAAFFAFLTGPGVDGSNDQAIYKVGSSTSAPVVRKGDQAPAAAPGTVFSSFNGPVINATGQIAFEGRLTGAGVSASNDRGIYREASGSLATVARAGDQAPGAAPGVVFRGFNAPVLNAVGQIAFFAGLSGPGVNSSNDTAVYATDLNGVLIEIIREGNLLDVNDDPLIVDSRTVSRVALTAGSGNEDGGRSGFNDLGQIAFLASFTDGSRGVFVSNAVASDTPCSPADLSSASNPGVPDGVLTGADFFEFLARFQAGDLSVDYSSASNPGVPDGVLTGADFFEFLNLFAAGC